MSWSSRNCSNITHCNMDLMRFSARKDASDDLLSEESGSLKISSKEIYSATDNLSADNFIDQGRAGKVYKGILSNGKHVAVKHIINDGSVETFICEVTSLPDVRHPNLVACEGVEEYFLVYELCQNGDLSGWLFGKDKSLPWITRLELAIDSAGGLWLLQTYPRGCIVLRDIKVALNFLHFFCLHHRCCFICHFFHQTSFLATFPTGNQQTFSLTKTFK
ncbi:wall-associated receptor kinase-like 6 [Malus domestica]|uniref:wall-associated receptor kinase-like 6 n=1 Tax=Malus domestica TaxID=3750 RepID=UPI003975FDFA